MERKLIGLFWFNIFIFFICFIIALLYISKEVLIYSQTESIKTDSIIKSKPLVQLLYISGDINLIEIRLKNVEDLNHDSFALQLEDQKDMLLKQLDLNGYNIGDDEWVKFKFIPDLTLSGSTTLILSSETLESNPIRAFENSNNDLNIKVFSNDTVFNTFLKTLNGLWIRFISDSSFFIIYFLLLFSLGSFFLYLNFPVQKKYD